MTKNTTPQFRWEPLAYGIDNIKPLVRQNLIIKSLSFRHGDIDKNNQDEAHRTIWNAFKQFTAKCLKEIQSNSAKNNCEYYSTYGFPSASMPDGSEIISMHHFGEHDELHFIWVKGDFS